MLLYELNYLVGLCPLAVLVPDRDDDGCLTGGLLQRAEQGDVNQHF